MHIAHLFDRYLNTTMNWAYNLIREMPDAETSIAAPLIVQNEFLREDFRFIYAPFQWERNANEWDISLLQRRVAQLFFQYLPLYQQFTLHVFRMSRPELLHAHFANVAWHYLPLAKNLGVPFIASFYGYDYEQLPFRKPQYNERYRQLFREAQVILCEGPHGKSILMQRGCPEEKIQVLPLGINPEVIPFITRTKPAGRLRLLQAATFTEKKGHRFTLEAFRLALQQCPDLHLTLAGEPINQAILKEIRQFVRENGLEDRIAICDFVPFGQFHSWLRNFDVFIQPSCYAADRDCEGGAPIVLLDAQATGMPILSTTHCDIPAEVIHGQTGLLCPEKDVRQLAAHIRIFYEMDETEYHSYCLAARKHVELNFDIRNSRAQLRQIYQNLIKAD
jgi:colanic acid/amylovoran biosynthesis glycosyltransferase